ncbi:TetR/AcrR family transcriptional regulator [Baekduia soli]|uniref:TetR/AcrR family transcriptional regulator n=1 Tax=Baekduia soli TaxID=496014 RepID=A0A5B8U849_9ACTN|nr:TetR/AcrR family transcriptional regulator [Baekduia soli]QEC49190.1 TetR/AcrR family transcriptional regulator [Baekduia soli]
MSAVADRPRRADALRNRLAVIRAATEVFAEKGLEAGIPEVAARAGVGRATVYRSFPSKEHLVAAVAVQRLEWVTEIATAALLAPDPGIALQSVIAQIAERQAGDCSVAGSMASDSHLPDLAAARAATNAALAALVERARDAGAARPDATGDDLRVLLTGVATVLRADGQRDPAVWRRYGRLVADALRAR